MNLNILESFRLNIIYFSVCLYEYFLRTQYGKCVRKQVGEGVDWGEVDLCYPSYFDALIKTSALFFLMIF